MAFSTSLFTLFLKALVFANLVASASVAISRTGWTATADSFQTGNEPAKALDGSATTFWHSEYDPTPVDPLPNWIVVDMKVSYNINAVSLQPRPADSGNGRIGGHRIEVSADNSTWQLVALGTYNNDATTKKTFFVSRPARYVRITATSEAQSAANQWTAVAEINIFQDTTYTAPVAGKGLWEKTVDFPLVPAAVSLLTNGKVLIWSAFAKDTFGGARGFTQTGIYDPAPGESSQLNVSNTQHDMFCPGISLDFNGRVIVTGGSNAEKTSNMILRATHGALRVTCELREGISPRLLARTGAYSTLVVRGVETGAERTAKFTPRPQTHGPCSRVLLLVLCLQPTLGVCGALTTMRGSSGKYVQCVFRLMPC
jgi:galactose oxidase